MREDPGFDLLMERLRLEDPASRADRRARERESAYARAWAAARRQGFEAEPEIGRFILERLYPELPPTVLDQFETLLCERAAAGQPGIRRPAPRAADTG